ncbi:hypothetical protein DPMN_141990 [Dreissena polymorpha]|uniref:Uncharacterized protein n=1 Tax=Dreissena polymorpha TaxID=45954 RepID=A0A9D4JKF1_DREPO|nr:hypothetical protein DPMN_141990 [Dreissena polymorpha]
MTQAPMAHAVYPVQYHSMAQEAQPVHYQLTHGARSVNRVLTQVSVTPWVYPVQYHAMSQEAQPVQYLLTHGVQSGQYQAVTQMPVAHGTYPMQYHAMAQRAQPMPYQVMTQVPVSQGGCIICTCKWVVRVNYLTLLTNLNRLICFHQDSRGM